MEVTVRIRTSVKVCNALVNATFQQLGFNGSMQCHEFITKNKPKNPRMKTSLRLHIHLFMQLYSSMV